MTCINNKNQTIYQLFLLLLLALTWLDIFDNMVYASNSETLKEALASFLSLKAFSGIIAVLVDSGASIKLLGTGVDIAIGKIFEPIRDFANTASNVMLLSMLSLTLQKFFLAIMQSVAIKTIITINVVILSINHFTPIISKKMAIIAFKALVVLWFLRFMIPVTELITYQVTSNVLKVQAEATSKKMQDLENRLEKLQAEMVGSSANNLKKEKQLTNLNTQLDGLEAALEKKEKERENYDVASTFMEFDFLKKRKTLNQEETIELRNIEGDIASITNDIKSTEKEIEILENTNSSIADKILYKLKTIQETQMVQMNIFVDEWINTTMLFFLRTVLMPILLLWLLFKIVDSLFRASFAEKMEGEIQEYTTSTQNTKVVNQINHH